MRFPALLLTTLALTIPFKAKANSCHENCYIKKVSCNQSHGHTFNSCDKDLLACKTSCNSDKSQKAFKIDRIPYELAPHLL